MYFPNFSAEGIDQLLAEAQCRMSEKIADFASRYSAELFPRETDLSSVARERRVIFLIESGQVEVSIDDRPVIIYEVGDVAGLEAMLPLSCVCACIAKEFAVRAIPLPLDQLEQELGYSVHIGLLAEFSAILCRAFTASIPETKKDETLLTRYNDGDIIMEQGSYGDDIYTLIEGRADVMVDGKKVGEVREDEVFGALAAITNIGRTATIVARDSCLVLGIKKDRLIELIKIRPGTVEKLVGDLARVINDLNKQLTNKM